MDVNVKNVKAVEEKKISTDGRIYGLSDFVGYTAKVCIIEGSKEKK